MINIVVILIYGGVKLLRYVETDMPLILAYPAQRADPLTCLTYPAYLYPVDTVAMTPLLIKSGGAGM